MTYCVVRRDRRTLAIADANDPRVGPYVERASASTFWDYHEACEHGRALADQEGIDFQAATWKDTDA